jgi:glycosyltransferase involved in cell wall biosynthesis
MSEEDSELLKQKAISTPIKYIPVAIEVAKIKTDLSQTNCFHIGSMNWQPNIEAVNYLIDQLWLKKPNLPNLTIAGSHSETINSQRFPSNVLIAGRVPDVNAFMSNAGVLVSPIKSGSGIRIKLLEALALGVPCITTKLGAAGINSEEAGVLLAETPEEWELQIQLLTSSIKLREENSQKSIAYILNKHSFANCKLLIETALEG